MHCVYKLSYTKKLEHIYLQKHKINKLDETKNYNCMCIHFSILQAPTSGHE